MVTAQWERVRAGDVEPFMLIRVCTLDGCSRVRRIYHVEPAAEHFTSIRWFGFDDGRPVRGEYVARTGDRVEVAR